MGKTTALYGHHAFWYISQMSTTRPRREICYCDYKIDDVNAHDDECFAFFLNLDGVHKNPASLGNRGWKIQSLKERKIICSGDRFADCHRHCGCLILSFALLIAQQTTEAPNENMAQNHLKIALLNVFQYLNGRHRHNSIP